MESSELNKFKKGLTFAIDKAHKPIVWIDSFDYGYIHDFVEELYSDEKKDCIAVWHSSTGIITNMSGEFFIEPTVIDSHGNRETKTSVLFSEAIKWFVDTPHCIILLAQVSDEVFNDKKSTPTLQDFVFQNNIFPVELRRTIILVSSTHIEVSGLEHICERFTLPLPNIKDIDEELGFINTNVVVRDKNNRIINVGRWKEVKEVVEKDRNGFYSMKDATRGLVCRDNQMRVLDLVYNDYKKLKYPFSDDFYDDESLFKKHYQELVDSLCGMHLYDIKELLNSLKVKGENNEIQYEYDDKDGKYHDDKQRKLIDIISERKTEIIKNSGLLEIIEYKEGYHEQVADIVKLKKYIDIVRKRIDSPNNYPPKLPKPKGILLVGAPGCGKSESAKAIASKLEKPLYRLNIGSLLGHKYGQSENRFIEALQTADASAPCVLWIDEIEKAFAGAGNESENDDTLTHIVGYFLTWMQEHKTMVYLVATANDLSRMKPEMLRKGRWDEIFYLSYPSDKGCHSIIKAILEKKFEIKLDSAEGNEDVLARAMSKIPMSGSEIENVLVETVKLNPIFKPEDKKWHINDGDIACVLLKLLKDRKMYQQELDKITEKEFKEMDSKTRFDILRAFIEGSSSNNVSDEDFFLKKKIDDEIQEMKIKHLGELPNEEDIRMMLKEKYEGQYKFTKASESDDE